MLLEKVQMEKNVFAPFFTFSHFILSDFPHLLSDLLFTLLENTYCLSNTRANSLVCVKAGVQGSKDQMLCRHDNVIDATVPILLRAWPHILN